MTAVIQTDRLTKRFGGKPALDGLTLAVPEGGIYALLGENGAGKSTTMKLLTGQWPADAGGAKLLGRDCFADAVGLRHEVGYVPERPRFYDWMTVEELGRFAAGFHRPGFLARYREAAAGLRLDPSAKLRELSKGGYAKAGLALALAPDPRVLLLDEPTSGLDLLVRREFLSSMVELAAGGRTVLITSHQIAEVERVASHAAFLAGGRLLLAGPLDEVKRRVVRVRVRSVGAPPALDNLGTVLDEVTEGRQREVTLLDPDRRALDGWRDAAGVESVEETPLPLEDVYTALMAHAAGGRRERAGELVTSAGGRP